MRRANSDPGRQIRRLLRVLCGLALLSTVAATPGHSREQFAGVASVEDRGSSCAIAELPPYDSLMPNATLPDPFLGLDGSRVKRKDEWPCRRAEIAAQIEKYQLGPKPPRPDQVSGQFDGERLLVTTSLAGRKVSFSATLVPPKVGKPPYPVMIVLGRRTWLDHEATISGHGVAMMYLDVGTIAEQQNAASRGKGEFYELYPDHPAGAMMAWAWGVSRTIDALQTTPEAHIDASRVGVAGCSRFGKGALVAGAYDERIALTISQESGAGGSSLWRVADVNQQAWIDAGKMPEYGAVQTLSQIVDENTWFRDSFRQFATSANRLPFDQHLLMGLVAPRALLVVNNTDMYWLDRQGSHLGALAAHTVWEALGVADRMGTRQVGGHPHCSGLPQSQLDTVAAFVGKFLANDHDANTRVLYSDGEFPDLRADWIHWDTPKLLAPDADRIWSGLVPAAKQHVRSRLPQIEALKALEGGALFIGDSITEGAPLGAMFPRLPSANYGIGWDTTDGLLLRLDQIIRNRPERAFILIGTNDLGYGHSAQHIAANIELLVETLSSEMPQTEFYVVSILPRESMNDRIQEANAILRKHATNRTYTYLDLASHMAADDGTLRPDLTFDGLHLNVHGYALWSSLLDECARNGCRELAVAE